MNWWWQLWVKKLAMLVGEEHRFWMRSLSNLRTLILACALCTWYVVNALFGEALPLLKGF